MENYIIIAVVAVIICLAGFYVYRAKKSGKKCIGCPNGGSNGCGGSCSSCSSCGSCGCGMKKEENINNESDITEN